MIGFESDRGFDEASSACEELEIELPEEGVTSENNGEGSLTAQETLDLLESQAAILITVSTDLKARKEDHNAKYKRARRQLNATLRAMGIAPPFPYEDLSEWHGRWSGGRLPTYDARRTHIHELAAPARDALAGRIAGQQLCDPGSSGRPTWSGVDARIDAVSKRLPNARTRDDFQDVGRRCREILIDAAKLLADPSLAPEGTEVPKDDDAKAWLELVLDSVMSGGDRKRLRALIRPTWQLANQVTHDGDHVETFAAAQATILIVRTLQRLI